MRVLVALIAFVAVAALNLFWWWWPNRPVEITGWTTAPLQSVSFAPYRPGQSPLTRTFPTPDQIEEDLRRLQGKVRAVRTYSAGENLGTVPQRAGKYGLKVWHGAWLNDNDKENLEQVNLLIDHANKYPDTIERVIVANADFMGGFALWVDEEHRLHHTYSFLGVQTYRQVSSEPIPTGDITVRMLFESEQPVVGSTNRYMITRMLDTTHRIILSQATPTPRS